MSPQLARFYHEIKAWIDAETPSHRSFHPGHGLCDNLNDWLIDQRLSSVHCYELKQQFVDAGLNRTYPFNSGEHGNYHNEHHTNSIFRNPKRCAWINNHQEPNLATE